MLKQFTVVQQVYKNPEDHACKKMVEAEVLTVTAQDPMEAYENALDKMVMNEIAKDEIRALRFPVQAGFDYDFTRTLIENNIDGCFIVYQGLHTANTSPSGPVAAYPGPPEGDPIHHFDR